MPRPAIHPCCLAGNVPEVARAMQLIVVRTGATVVESAVAAAAVGSGGEAVGGYSHRLLARAERGAKGDSEARPTS